MMNKIFLIASLIMGLPVYALAGLGGAVDSFQNNPAPAMVLRHAATATTNSVPSSYTTQQMQDNAGNLITEYVTPNGVVFALTWRGAFKPDLRQLLGNYFQTFLSVEGSSVGRHPQIVAQNSVVVVSEGRLRNFHGSAYVPALVPNDFSLDNLK